MSLTKHNQSDPWHGVKPLERKTLRLAPIEYQGDKVVTFRPSRCSPRLRLGSNDRVKYVYPNTTGVKETFFKMACEIVMRETSSGNLPQVLVPVYEPRPCVTKHRIERVERLLQRKGLKQLVRDSADRGWDSQLHDGAVMEYDAMRQSSKSRKKPKVRSRKSCSSPTHPKHVGKEHCNVSHSIGKQRKRRKNRKSKKVVQSEAGSVDRASNQSEHNVKSSRHGMLSQADAAMNHSLIRKRNNDQKLNNKTKATRKQLPTMQQSSVEHRLIPKLTTGDTEKNEQGSEETSNKSSSEVEAAVRGGVNVTKFNDEEALILTSFENTNQDQQLPTTQQTEVVPELNQTVSNCVAASKSATESQSNSELVNETDQQINATQKHIQGSNPVHSKSAKDKLQEQLKRMKAKRLVLKLFATVKQNPLQSSKLKKSMERIQGCMLQALGVFRASHARIENMHLFKDISTMMNKDNSGIVNQTGEPLTFDELLSNLSVDDILNMGPSPGEDEDLSWDEEDESGLSLFEDVNVDETDWEDDFVFDILKRLESQQVGEVNLKEAEEEQRNCLENRVSAEVDSSSPNLQIKRSGGIKLTTESMSSQNCETQIDCSNLTLQLNMQGSNSNFGIDATEANHLNSVSTSCNYSAERKESNIELMTTGPSNNQGDKRDKVIDSRDADIKHMAIVTSPMGTHDNISQIREPHSSSKQSLEEHISGEPFAGQLLNHDRPEFGEVPADLGTVELGELSADDELLVLDRDDSLVGHGIAATADETKVDHRRASADNEKRVDNGGASADDENTKEKSDEMPVENDDAIVENGEVPVENEEAPADHDETPVENDEAPVENDDAPPDYDETPAEYDVTPVEYDESPAEHEKTSVENDEAPVENGETPAEYEETPVENDEAPVEYDEAPVEYDETPVKNDEAKMENEGMPVEYDEAPVENDEAPVENDEEPVENDEAPVENDEEPVENDEAPVENDETTVEYDEAPVENDETTVEYDGSPAEYEETSVENDETPAEYDEAPVENDETPVENDEAPVENDEAIVENENTPVENKEMPVENKETPAEYDETPVDHDEAEVENDETPVEYDETPAEYDVTPADHDETPVGYDESPAEHEKTSVEFDEAPVENDETTVENDETPVENDEAPVENEEMPVEYDETPVENDEAPVGNDEAPVENDKTPVEYDESPAEHEKTSVEFDEAPVENDEAPVEYDETPVEYDETPVEYDETLVEYDETPVENDESPEDFEETLVDHDEPSVENAESPVENDESPEDFEETLVDHDEPSVENAESPVENEKSQGEFDETTMEYDGSSAEYEETPVENDEEIVEQSEKSFIDNEEHSPRKDDGYFSSGSVHDIAATVAFETESHPDSSRSSANGSGNLFEHSEVGAEAESAGTGDFDSMFGGDEQDYMFNDVQESFVDSARVSDTIDNVFGEGALALSPRVSVVSERSAGSTQD